MEAACISRFFKGLDPWCLTYRQWNGYLEAIGRINELESGKTDHRAAVERMMRQRENEDV